MKKLPLVLTCIALSASSCATRHVRTACDITPGNCGHARLDWRYGANDIRIQTCKLSRQIMDQWFTRTHYKWEQSGRPRLIITEVDNRTDMYISTDMIRDILETEAIQDGRYTVLVGDSKDQRELDQLLQRITYDPKYSNQLKPNLGKAKAPQFLAKIRLTKAVNKDLRYDYEDYRMTITLYDVETQVAIDSAYDVLRKRVEG